MSKGLAVCLALSPCAPLRRRCAVQHRIAETRHLLIAAVLCSTSIAARAAYKRHAIDGTVLDGSLKPTGAKS
jgi:hypothetical protein